MATYSAVRITTTTDTAVSSRSGSITTVDIVPASTSYDLISLTVDATNDILTGRNAAGDQLIFELGAPLTISILA